MSEDLIPSLRDEESYTKAIKFICDNLPQENEDWVNALEDAGLYDFEAEERALDNDEDYEIASIYCFLIALGVSEEDYSKAFPNTNYNWPERSSLSPSQSEET